MYLQIEHRKKDFKKTWKIESGPRPFSIGHSRNADIRLDKQFDPIAGVFECQQGEWRFTRLHKPDGSEQTRLILIQGPTVIPLKDGELHVSPFDRQIELFKNDEAAKTADSKKEWLWLVWKRNDKVWYSEFKAPEQAVRWPHNQKMLALAGTRQWQKLENEGVTLSYKLVSSPSVQGLFDGAFKGIFDPTLRPYLAGAGLACLLVGALSFLGTKLIEKPVVAPPRPNLSETTLIRVEKKVAPVQPPKNAVAKALAQTSAPKADSSPKPSSRRALGQVFSMIGRRALSNIAIGNGPKTIAITATTAPSAAPSTAKSFKVLGSFGTGTGLGPSSFTKGLAKEGGVGIGNGTGTIGGANLGQISQGNVGQGDLGLLHKESQVSGGLDRDVIAKYIQSQKGKILYCYERQLSANPGLFGKVSVKFQIAPGGEVESSSITESTLGSSSVENCLLQLIGQWRFPKPEGGVRVLVSYPFVFKSLN